MRRAFLTLGLLIGLVGSQAATAVAVASPYSFSDPKGDAAPASTTAPSVPPGQSPITPSASPTPAGEGVADPDDRIAFGGTTRYDDLFAANLFR